MQTPLSIAIAGLDAGPGHPWSRPGGGVDPRRAIEWVAGFVASHGVRSIQLDVTMPEVRPRDLDRSGRRDLAALLRRCGLSISGLDLFIPPEHFSDAASEERAVGAAGHASGMLAELAGLVDARRVARSFKQCGSAAAQWRVSALSERR